MSNTEGDNTEQPENNERAENYQVDKGLATPAPNPLQPLVERCDAIRAEIHKLIVGQDEYIDLLLAALLSGGHALVEGVPGIAKTMTSKIMAKTLNLDYSRIQFTPDLMPNDVIGTQVFQMKTSEFHFRKGPIFAHVILIDEVNRAPAKTQSALFEVMEERQVTVDGETHLMDEPFIVLATQNPLEQEGTYKLPEAQMDRFLYRIGINYPSESEELEMLLRFSDGTSALDLSGIKPVISAKQIMQFRQWVHGVRLDESLLQYIVQIVQNTRNNSQLYLGASPRASLSIMRSAKAFAAMAGRDFATPDDIHRSLYPVLNHRIMLSPESEMEGTTLQNVLNDIIEKLEVPR